MNKDYMLDTDVISYRIRGASAILAQKMRYAGPGNVFVSAISVAELLFGIKGRAPGHPRRVDVELFLSGATILDWDVTAAAAYADIRYSLTTTGRPIGELDMMIAAHALSRGYTLVSNNTRHYERLVPPLKLENWTEA